MEKINLNLSTPWYTFQRKVHALFRNDPDIQVGEIFETNDPVAQYAFDIEVKNHEKYIALDRVLPKIRRFGNVAVAIFLYDEENGEEQDTETLFKTIFDGNPLMDEIVSAEDFTGTKHTYVMFLPRVIQFFNDDISDLNGNWSGIAQEIAREVFEDARGVHFCTSPFIGEPEAKEEE
ncbi:MAG: hypothetical protein E7576_07920 [Ruminococcaceae bacterium]|nr:hypothetical protein [Oscillospiraceae bacterium]